MKITWLGTAGFKFESKDQVFFTDPYLTRNRQADPKQPLSPDGIKQADAIFLSHGHFDHIMDVPRIIRSSGAPAYCSTTAAKTLERNGIAGKQIKPISADDTLITFNCFKARALFSEHIKFDTRLVIATLLKINFNLFKFIRLMRAYPCGQVLSWRFYMDNKIIQFFGSAGAVDEELKRLAEEPVDILLLPLQGHSDICRIGADIVNHLKPRTVIVQHHDNFYPPVSQSIDIQPFLGLVKQSSSPPQVILPEINQPIQF